MVLTPFQNPRFESEASHLYVIPVLSCMEERIVLLSSYLCIHGSDGLRSVCLVKEDTSV